MLKKAVRSTVITVVLILMLWGILYHLTDFKTVESYFWTGVGVCVLNTFFYNLRKHEIENLFQVQLNWVVMAGVVLVLYHAGFMPAAVFVAAAILVSPLFWATMYEGIVGLTLLITLGHAIT